MSPTDSNEFTCPKNFFETVPKACTDDRFFMLFPLKECMSDQGTIERVYSVDRSAAVVLRQAALRPEVKPQLLWKNPQSEEKLENKSN